MKKQPTIIVIYAPTRRVGVALRERLIKLYEESGSMASIDETHWIAVGEDSSFSRAPSTRRSRPRKKV